MSVSVSSMLILGPVVTLNRQSSTLLLCGSPGHRLEGRPHRPPFPFLGSRSRSWSWSWSLSWSRSRSWGRIRIRAIVCRLLVHVLPRLACAGGWSRPFFWGGNRKSPFDDRQTLRTSSDKRLTTRCGTFRMRSLIWYMLLLPPPPPPSRRTS